MSSDARHPVRTRLAVAAVVLLGTAGLVLASPGAPGSAATADEATLASLVNGARAGAGLAPLTVSAALSETARSHSAAMAAAGSLFHTGDLAGAIGSAAPGWTGLAENVAVAGSVTEAHQALMASSVHRANILGDFTLLGVGVVQGGDGRVWVTEHFAKTTTATAAPAPAPVETTTSTSTAPADTTTTTTAAAVTVAAAAETTAPAPPPSPTRSRPTRSTTVHSAATPNAPAPDTSGDCLPEQAEGQGWAYGRCDEVPRGAATGRP